VENLITRYRNTTVLVIVLFAQVLGLAVQIKRPGESGSTRLLRLWVVNTITPIEKGLVSSGQAVRGVWTNYIYLRGVRRQNRELRDQIEQMRLEQVRLSEDASQARRLQALFGFKEQFISATVAAQVIGTSGSDLSRVFYIDKGANASIKPDMAVINADGIIGKVLRVYSSSAQVLEINDPSSGVGAILEKSRLQGILQGTASGELLMRYVMSDEKVAPGEVVLTSGGDRIFPKGLPVGTVIQSSPGSDLFLNIRVKPSANLSRVEEVLVVTKIVEKAPDVTEPEGPQRAADILAQRLPTVPPKPAATEAKAAPGQTGAASGTGTKPAKPAASALAGAKPESAGTATAARTAATSSGGAAASNLSPAATVNTVNKPKTTTTTAHKSDTPGATTVGKPAAAANNVTKAVQGNSANTKPASALANPNAAKPASAVTNTSTKPNTSATAKPATAASKPAPSSPTKPVGVQANIPKPAKPANATHADKTTGVAATATHADKTAGVAATPQTNRKPVDTTPVKPDNGTQPPSPDSAGEIIR
jgi:rod shape-determining protein MreC